MNASPRPDVNPASRGRACPCGRVAWFLLLRMANQLKTNKLKGETMKGTHQVWRGALLLMSAVAVAAAPESRAMHVGAEVTFPAPSALKASLAFAPPSLAALTGTWRGDAEWKKEVGDIETRTSAPLELTIAAGGSISGGGNGCAFTGNVALGDGLRTFVSLVVHAAGCTDAAFNGDYRRARLERFGDSTIVARLRKGDDDDEVSISARLANAAGTPPPAGGAGAVSGDWTGNVHWEAHAPLQARVDVTKPLSLSISAAGAVSGTGFGCLFTGSVSRNVVSRAGATGQIHAAGCENALFNGDFGEVRFRISRDGAHLQIHLSRESGETEVEIEGDLGSGSAPHPPSADPGALAGTWGGSVGWLSISRDPSLAMAAIEPISFTLGSGGAFTGTGFGCAFAGELTLSSDGRRITEGRITATGCTHAVFNGLYTPQFERDDGSLEIELERESASVKVKIAGKVRRT